MTTPNKPFARHDAAWSKKPAHQRGTPFRFVAKERERKMMENKQCLEQNNETR